MYAGNGKFIMRTEDAAKFYKFENTENQNISPINNG